MQLVYRVDLSLWVCSAVGVLEYHNVQFRRRHVLSPVHSMGCVSLCIYCWLKDDTKWVTSLAHRLELNCFSIYLKTMPPQSTLSNLNSVYPLLDENKLFKEMLSQLIQPGLPWSNGFQKWINPLRTVSDINDVSIATDTCTNQIPEIFKKDQIWSLISRTQVIMYKTLREVIILCLSKAYTWLKWCSCYAGVLMFIYLFLF